MRRISMDFSYLSASWPAVADNRKKRQDKQRASDVRKLAVVHAGNQYALKCDQDDQALAENIVV